MPRGVKSVAGEALVSTDPNYFSRLPRLTRSEATDPADPAVPADAAFSAFGVLLRLAERRGVPAGSVFAPAELEARIAAHAERVARELAELPPLRRGGGRAAAYPSPPTLAERIAERGRKGRLPDGREWDSIRLVRCGGCRRWLLGAADEYLRDLVTAALPPAAAGRDAIDRVFCAPCYAEER